MSICSPFPNLNSAADAIESNNLQQMTFSSKASCKRSLVLLVTWNLIIVSGPCNIYAKANYGIYFWIVGASKRFDSELQKAVNLYFF